MGGDRSAAGELTASLAKSNLNLPLVFGHLRADCPGPGAAPE